MAPTLDELGRLLPDAGIAFDLDFDDRNGVIRHVGGMLVARGSVEASYIAEMLDRERAVSTYVGHGIAMPHGTLGAKDEVLAEGLAFVRLAHPVDWGGESVSVVIGIAARGRRYIALLSQLAAALLDGGRAEALLSAATPSEVRSLLAG
ncbi:PTS sugar transporter subunit IIA [Galbitalea soli]|uniref:Mannitol-specific phosphotransferase enzyme IIA component n=1 Tax=Galbitalea soli TaxID=1268042 RepID=A0A7C9TPL2_9MICO|nr:PTS sugar transporter subunit IIA [Galbitalea soli]NEM90180.1 PTS sugar transporter subunit IIA [Galbitalea soli]NYJ30888.1 PTS system mannitol-specific IIA component [Galbitalea soli]